MVGVERQVELQCTQGRGQLAFLCVGGATLLAAGILLLLARARSRDCTIVPRRTLASLRKHLAEFGEPFG